LIHFISSFFVFGWGAAFEEIREKVGERALPGEKAQKKMSIFFYHLQE